MIVQIGVNDLASRPGLLDNAVLGIAELSARSSHVGVIFHGVAQGVHAVFGKSSDRDPLGPRGEALAAKHLVAKGFWLLGQNLRVRRGEADLLMMDPDRETIVLVEVKSRRVPKGQAASFLPPEASVHADKRRKLRMVLRALVNANRWHGRPTRIDVVAIEFSCDGEAEIRHHTNAVPPI